MPHVTSFRLLLSSANHHHRHPFSAAPRFFSQNPFLSSLPFFSKTYIKKHHSLPYFTTFSSNNKSQTIKSTRIHVPWKKNWIILKVGMRDLGLIGRGLKVSDGNKKNLQIKVRKLNPVNTIAYVQILGTGMDTQDTSPSVLLFFDNQRFIFNAGEGLQRYCTEHKSKLSKIDHIFLSCVCSETAGGLPGLLLTLAGIGDEGMTVNVRGPSDLKYLLDAMKSFIPNAAMVYVRGFGPTLDSNGSPRHISKKFGDPLVLIDDEVIKISAIT